MNLFLAAVHTNQYRPGQAQWPRMNEREQQVFGTIPNILESYHYVGKQRFVDEMRECGSKVFVDSGAFSAKSLGIEIDIDEYCAYIIRNRDIIRVEDGVYMASVLDGIGNDLLTYQNQKYMEKKGATPLPCFHFGEDNRYLDYYVNNYPYITLGGMAHSQAIVMQWLDRVWNDYILDGAGRPKCKVHAFGVTSVNLMERYPWHSVDSSSWIQAASFGSVFTAEYGPIAVSANSPSRQEWGRHLTTFSAIEQAALRAKWNSEGFDFDRLSTVYQSRAAYNCFGYIELNKFINRQNDAQGGRFDCHAVQQLF